MNQRHEKSNHLRNGTSALTVMLVATLKRSRICISHEAWLGYNLTETLPALTAIHKKTYHHENTKMNRNQLVYSD